MSKQYKPESQVLMSRILAAKQRQHVASCVSKPARFLSPLRGLRWFEFQNPHAVTHRATCCRRFATENRNIKTCASRWYGRSDFAWLYLPSSEDRGHGIVEVPQAEGTDGDHHQDPEAVSKPVITKLAK